MSTNYYLHKYEKNVCDHCGRGDDLLRVHIGQSAYGYRFTFNSNYGQYPSFKEWKEELENNPDSIFDEYNEKQNLKEFLEHIESKQKDKPRFEFPLHVVGPYIGVQYGYDDNHDRLDPEGYRFAISSEFS